ELDCLLDEAYSLVDELQLVGHEGEEHADTHLAVERGGSADIDDGEVLGAEYQIIERLEEAAHALDAGIRRQHVGIAIGPKQVAPGLAVEHLDALDGARRLDEGRILARSRMDEVERALAEDTIEGNAQQDIDREREQHDEAESGAIDEDHPGGQQRHGS